MSWYTDPQLFIYSNDAVEFWVYRVSKQFGINPYLPADHSNQENLTFSKHLYLGNNRESDYDAFKATFSKSEIKNFKNCLGWVINWDYGAQKGTWSREEPNSALWSLPGITKKKSATEEALEKKVSELEEKISSLEDDINNSKAEKEAQEKKFSSLEEEIEKIKEEKEASDKRVLDLEAELNKERGEKSVLINGLKREDMLMAGLEALQQQVLDLPSKLSVQCCGAAGSGGSSMEEPWITGQTVPSNWVPFEDLDVQPFSKNIPLMITNATGGLKFGDDNTTNVQASRFYGGIYPIVVVHIAELTPNREEARFDPDVWSRYTNAGITYAAREPFPSEMAIDAHKTC